MFALSLTRFSLLLFLLPVLSFGEAMVQYFNTSYRELTHKIPELAEVGYNSIWLPPPTKGSGGLSVGYDLWDRFDLGSKDQRGTVRTRYGTEAELHQLIRVAHRFGIRIYFDTIMNHNAFDVPGFNEFTPIDIYPGFIAAEDFHLRRTAEGFYRKWDNTRNWNDAWQVQYLGLSDLIDIANEAFINGNHGSYEGATFPKYVGVRHPANPEYYCVDKDGNYVGFNSPVIAAQMAANPADFNEDVNAMLIRSVRWLMDHTKADGLRLDAVKHTPDYFFGEQYGAFKDGSNAGYLGAAQEQFNLTRGFSDWNNHRDSVFSTEIPRDDAMMFGEHLGEPPGFQGYVDAGMRLVDNELRSWLNGRLGSPFAGIDGLDQPGGGGFDPAIAVMHAQSHDNDFAARRELQHATYFTRAGLPLVYTDGNFHAETLGESGGAFPRHANTTFLGQFGDKLLTNIVYVHNQFARGSQRSAFSDPDFVAYERIDNREGHTQNHEAATMLFMMNDNFSNGAGRNVSTSFPATGGTAFDAYLHNYSPIGGSFYTYASQLGGVIVPPGGYFIFSYRSPEPSDLWAGDPIAIYQNGALVTDTLCYERRDGSDGDPGFNPYGVADADSTDFAYTYCVPRVTSGNDLRFSVRTDGSSDNVLLKLDGGINLNSQSHPGGDGRDNPPALATDTFLGYEQMDFVQRQQKEKFAAEDSANRNVIGSAGAETWTAVIGSAGFTTSQGAGFDSDVLTAQWVYHDPRDASVPGGTVQFLPAPANAANAAIDVWTKLGNPGDVNRAVIYYTTDGSFPEGAGGEGSGTTQSAEMQFQFLDAGADWWKGTIPAQPLGATLRYKIGAFDADPAIGAVFPSSASNVGLKKRMMTVFELDNFDATTVSHHPHNDYGPAESGLDEGFHILSARAFLKRDGGSPFPGTSIYNTFPQTFYYDAQTPTGELKFPVAFETLGGSEYEAVVRTDATVEQVFFHIDDPAVGNDDGTTMRPNGNGLNAAGNDAWVEASEVTPSLQISSAYPREWRFKIRNIPSANVTGAVRVRLLELSSSTNMTLSATAGHFTELSTPVTFNGPNHRFYFDWPNTDGTPVGAGYTGRVFFEDTLGNGLNNADLNDSFSVEVIPDGNSSGFFLPKTSFTIARSIGGGLGRFEVTLPDLYDSNAPNRLYTLRVRQVNVSGVQSETSVRVTAIPTPPAPFIDIIEPEEVDVIGNRQTIEVTSFPTQQLVRVSTDSDPSSVVVTVDGVAIPFLGTSTGGTNRIWWDYQWTITAEGTFAITADRGDATDTVNIPVRFVERVVEDPNDLDDDNDGLLDTAEQTNPGPPPSANSDTWTQAQVHDEWALGQTGPLQPDTDLDGLPDGLELGYRNPSPPAGDPAETDTGDDTNNDGTPNFVADRDPPYYNTLDNLGNVPEVTNASIGGNRRSRVAGTTTDPNNPDSDSDGIPDGIEDANRNGWIDGDGEDLPPSFNPWLGRDWPDGVMDAGETWLETDPNNPDTDGDGIRDGDEDANRDGMIAGDTNGDRVLDSGETWTETNPLDADTDGDGLPDGWEVFHGLDPLDPTGPNGASGNPDGDTLGGSAQGDPYTNLLEFQNGTHPLEVDIAGVVNGDAITVGPGPMIGMVNGQAYFEEFRDWNKDDLIVLDEYEGDGNNNRSGDLFIGGDGFDSSRDMVAFYARDGGTALDKFYFRVDMHDLQPFAEESGLDLYVVINVGNPGAGEKNLPDEVDTITDLGWQVVVAVYDSNNGNVYVDLDPNNNTTSFGQSLTGIDVRDRSHPAGFEGAYFNSELDAVEFAITRSALTDAGWNGLDAANFSYQVFTTKDGTQNDGTGAGDLGGRSDVRDSIYDDNVAEDYWRDQGSLQNRLTTGFGVNGFNDIGKCASVAMLVHGNQPIRPGASMQNLINDGQGAGYHRTPLVHDMFDSTVNLHITATLASALEWAATDPATPDIWRLGSTANGPRFNDWIASLMATNTVELLGSTTSDHMLPYFPHAYHVDNVAFATDTLTRIYGAPSRRVLWLPERLADSATLAEVDALGYSHTCIDQFRHVLKWFGRTSALTEGGYRVNRVENTDCFVINDFASEFLFETHDNGLAFALRNIVAKRARSGTQDQLLTLFKAWEEFGDVDKADAYDLAVRWLANRPWIDLVSLDDIAADPNWGQIDRGRGLALPKVAQDWIDHATDENYDHWYYGSALEEGLFNRVFESRPTAATPEPWGQVGVTGMIDQAWTDLQSITHPDVRELARATLHASVFQTAFHNQANGDLSKFSTGDYINPDNDPETIAPFAARAQAQTRMTSMFRAIDQWAANPPAAPTTSMADIDQDGFQEWTLANQNLFAIFEANGGRMVAAFMRDRTNQIMQVIGNFAGYDGDETENEGIQNIDANGTAAHRTSGFKDWFAAGPGSSHVNGSYNVVTLANGLQLSSIGGPVTKTITLGDNTSRVFEVAYNIDPSVIRLYVRHGLSLDLRTLLTDGQAHLTPVTQSNTTVTVRSLLAGREVNAILTLGSGTIYESAATDDDNTFETVPMRNQAQTEQLEISGAGNFDYTLAFEPKSLPTVVVPPNPDPDNDGIPTVFEDLHPFLNPNDPADALLDQDGDLFTNLDEYIAGTNLDDANEFPVITDLNTDGTGSVLYFPTKPGRNYTVWYKNHTIMNPPADWTIMNTATLAGTGGVVSILDDGTMTSPAPNAPALFRRFYRVTINLAP